MSRRALAVVFAVALAVMLAALTPLRIVLGAAGAAGLGLSAERIEGPFWAGLLTGARAGAMPLGDLRASINPLGLMLARDDAARLASVTVRDASGEPIPLRDLAAYRPSGP